MRHTSKLASFTLVLALVLSPTFALAARNSLVTVIETQDLSQDQRVLSTAVETGKFRFIDVMATSTSGLAFVFCSFASEPGSLAPDGASIAGTPSRSATVFRVAGSETRLLQDDGTVSFRSEPIRVGGPYFQCVAGCDNGPCDGLKVDLYLMKK